MIKLLKNWNKSFLKRMNLNEELVLNAVKKAANDLSVGYQGIQNHLQFLRFYDNLYVMFGGDIELMEHWLYTGNSHLKYTPVLRIYHGQYIEQMNEYLESFRNR
jgi:hypothetical protein